MPRLARYGRQCAVAGRIKGWNYGINPEFAARLLCLVPCLCASPPTTFAVLGASGNARKVSPSLLHLAAFLALKLFVFALQMLLLRNRNRAGKENNEHRCLGGAARHVAGGEPVPCLSINTATAFCKHMPLCGGLYAGSACSAADGGSMCFQRVLPWLALSMVSSMRAWAAHSSAEACKTGRVMWL